MPLHKGHLYCIDVAASQCDRVVVIMFINLWSQHTTRYRKGAVEE